MKEEFLDRVASVLEVPAVDAATEFRNVPTWSSLCAFALVVMLQQKYSVSLTLNELGSLVTVGDLMKAAGVDG